MIGDERWLQLILRPRHALWDVPLGLNDQLVIEMAVAALIDSCFAIGLTFLSIRNQRRNQSTPPIFRATGITNYLENGGTLRVAKRIAGHADSRTTKLYGRRGQKVLLEDMERIWY